MLYENIDCALREVEAATKIQAVCRGFFDRKTYQFNQLPSLQQESYPVIIEGNDPKIEGLPQHHADESIALIGTSGMRAVAIACHLSKGSLKLIILDNSKDVVGFWRQARALINLASTSDEFICDLDRYIRRTGCCVYRDSGLAYLHGLFSIHGFDRLKSIIGRSTVIAQSWADKDILVQVKNILVKNGVNTIYAYPSNIVGYIEKFGRIEDAQQVLKNIQILAPALAIHTDLVNTRPVYTVQIRNHDPAFVREQLRLSRYAEQATSTTTPVM